jgi:hypothetical protein
MRLTNDKSLNALLKDAEQNGWVFTVTSNHIKAKHPSGQTATIAKTPSDFRALKNIRSHLKVKQ